MRHHPGATEGMVKALARVVSNVQVQETSGEGLAAVAGMLSSKAKVQYCLLGQNILRH